ncbi:uncharacterized protein LOC128954854 [Oppia nitens]|uniref:uncharacterized protein LOC128954854 n=1 Tax=Oppia nitens TaxID=1686743 RepID=UPI0023DA587D|nr:uncharacterized protein LOC128954854 [Oppia nitens]
MLLLVVIVVIVSVCVHRSDCREWAEVQKCAKDMWRMESCTYHRWGMADGYLKPKEECCSQLEIYCIRQKASKDCGFPFNPYWEEQFKSATYRCTEQHKFTANEAVCSTLFTHRRFPCKYKNYRNYYPCLNSDGRLSPKPADWDSSSAHRPQAIVTSISIIVLLPALLAILPVVHNYLCTIY